MCSRNELLYFLFINHYGEFLNKEYRDLLDFEYIQREKDKLFNISHKDRYFNLKLMYESSRDYKMHTEDTMKFISSLLALHIITDKFIGVVYLNENEISNILKNEHYYRLYDRKYNYCTKLKTNKIKPNP